MGGRGKTPTVALVARVLLAAGERPAILSRGYRRRNPADGVVIVSDGRHRLADLDRSGDEPLMLARQVPGAAMLVSEVRALAAALAEASLGVTVHVLDDGFQHRSLVRDIDVVIVTPGDLADRRLPFGHLRSPVRALRDADAVIVDGDTAAAADVILADQIDPARTRVFTLTRSLGTPWWLEPAKANPDPGTGVSVGMGRVLALAGIASPARFAHALEAAGYVVADRLSLSDHHPFTRRDLARVRAVVARTAVDAVVTTEKDAMRLLPLRPLGVPVAAVPLDVSIDPPDTFRRWLLARLEEARSCS